MPDGDGYQVVFPHYPNCITFGDSVEEALKNAKEAIELLLEHEAKHDADPVPPNAHVSHVVVGEIKAEVPERLIESDKEIAKAVDGGYAVFMALFSSCTTE